MRANLSFKHLATLALLLLIAACSREPANNPVMEAAVPAEAATSVPVEASATPEPTATAVRFELRPSSTPIPSATPYIPGKTSFSSFGPDNYPINIDPLTGLEVADPKQLDRRPI